MRPARPGAWWRIARSARRSGARTIVLGHTGAGKSTLISRVSAAIASGTSFLEWIGVGELRVLLIDLEQSEADAKRMLREADLDQSQALSVALVPEGLELNSDDAQLAMVEQAVVDGGFGVVFDPYYKAHRAEDANAERQIDDLMRRLDGLRARHGFALVLGAHPRKPPVGLQPALTVHDLAGSGAAVRGAEIIVAIERVSDGYSRLRFLKDRAGRLPVGDAWGAALRPRRRLPA
jgi:RecA-family ATPase